jgi:membrane associated rhomboid family serine protease
VQHIIDSENDSLELTRRHFTDSVRLPVIFVVFLWLVHIYQYLSGFDPGEYGIMPRRVWSLPGIITGPMVHGSWGHLISNSFPLFVLFGIILYFFRKVALRAFWEIYFLTTISVWLLARGDVSHIGISGVVYGLVSFVFWNGIFRRSLRSIILAAIVMLLYSGMFAGVLPDQVGISWESHLLGSLVGILVSFLHKEEMEDDEEDIAQKDPFADERGLPKKPFLPTDIFDKTKAQRLEEALAEERRRQQAIEEWLRKQQEDQNPPFWNQSSTL